MDGAYVGHFFTITAAGMTNADTDKLNPARYPSWLRIYLIVLISVVWAGLLLGSALFPRIHVPNALHGIMGVAAASLLRVEFGGIKLITKEPEDHK